MEEIILIEGCDKVKNSRLDLMTVREAAQILHMCRQNVYKAIADGKLQGFKNDYGRYLIFKSSVEKYIDRCYNNYNLLGHSAEGGKCNAE